MLLYRMPNPTCLRVVASVAVATRVNVDSRLSLGVLFLCWTLLEGASGGECV
jgi:hypothetical protein